MSEQNTPPKKDNKGFLFVNGNKNKPTQPDQTGRFVLDGKEYRISAWDSTTTDGRPYLSLAITPYFPPNTQGQPAQSGQNYNQNSKGASNTNNQGNSSNVGYGGNKGNFTGAPISNDFDLDLDDILNNTDDEPFK